MAKITDDPKAVAYAEKEVGKAVKMERKRALDVVKAVPLPEEKAMATAYKAALKAVVAGLAGCKT